MLFDKIFSPTELVLEFGFRNEMSQKKDSKDFRVLSFLRPKIFLISILWDLLFSILNNRISTDDSILLGQILKIHW